ncbi:hypothetical protein [Neobacillus sp. YIM B06451]|uniref:hypothetical protein n=1 Tax=Neobacillus sp. YIM B06451 TaxID=3070994 RepID=UPI00292F894F|nr:hypothetical protein [Neobacillus sp. YIM B06451]
MTFDDFIMTHPTCRVVANSQTARDIYDKIIWKEANRIKMAELSSADIPALVACAQQIESHCASANSCDLDISNDTVKQVIGRMISVSLAPLGYEPAKKKRLPQGLAGSVFKNSTAYSLTGVATQYIDKRIVPIKD